MKKIIALCCGSKNGQGVTLVKAAAMGAAEFGVETEIIRAMELKVKPAPCSPKEDDVLWILEKCLYEDAGLIVAAPCYHCRANGYFYNIAERSRPVFSKRFDVLKKTRVGATIGVAGNGYDGWASMMMTSMNEFVQHTRVLVDQIQVNRCGMKEWNLWMQQDGQRTHKTHLARTQDMPYEKNWETFPQNYGTDFLNMAIERAKELGRNVARAMDMPIEEVKYVGEEAGVACPVCHCNTLLVPEDLPHVYCPVCSVRGKIVDTDGKMKVEWNQADAKFPRFSHDGVRHHVQWLRDHGEWNRKNEAAAADKIKEVSAYGKFIVPDSSGGTSVLENIPEFYGLVTQNGDGKLTVVSPDGRSMTFLVDSNTKVAIDMVEGATVAGLEKEQRIEVEYDASNNLALKIKSRPGSHRLHARH